MSTVEIRAILKDEITPGIKAMQGQLSATKESVSSMSSAWKSDFDKIAASLEDNIFRLRAQKEILQDPVYSKAIAHAKELRQEIDALTKAQTAENHSLLENSRSRREVMVMMHELSQGRYKNLASSAMVLGESGDMEWMKTLTSLITPMNIAIAGAGVAFVGLGAAMWKASEASAEMYHKMELLGKVEGVNAQTMLGFQQLTIGTGASVEQVGQAFARFTINLDKHRDSLARVGITAKDPLEAFEQLMDVAKNTGDATQRNEILNEALGKSWQKLAPFLVQGGEAAKEAIASMKIPEETIQDYERANQAQIQIDRSWMAIKLHAGEATAGVRAFFKEIEAGAAKDIEKRGIFTGILASLTYQGRAYQHQQLSTGDVNPTDFRSQKAEVLTEGQQKALEEAKKAIGKKDVNAAIENVKAEWAGRLAEFKVGSANYLEVLKAEQAEEARVRASFAKKNSPKGDGSGKYTELDPNGTMRNQIQIRDPSEFKPSDQGDREGALKQEHKLALEKRKDAIESAKLEQQAEQNSYLIQSRWEKVLADERKKDHQERIKQATEYATVVQGFAAKELESAMHGTLTKKALEKDFTDLIIKEIAERGTKWIAEEAIKLAFSEGATATNVGTQEIAAATTSAAWATPSMEASIATSGGATAAGSAAWFEAMAGASSYSLASHAKGGFGVGPSWMHESGPEAVNPIVPYQVTTASHTTTNTTHAPITIHIHGGDQAKILRTIRNAAGNGKDTSH